ncbi:MAG TPA: T9SS type A sorting domain-containing protein [Prolixibacteraceae bacterium]|nr:T9SS type A sorting domain-containing protein [Prolixibacteraceae bacterium]
MNRIVFLSVLILPVLVFAGNIAVTNLQLPEVGRDGLLNPQDNEPNNSWQTANVFIVNGSTSGTLNYDDDYYDYYQVTIPSDGQLSFTLVPGGALDGYLDLYDQNGYSFLRTSTQTGVGVTDNLIYENLKAGTYYIRVGGSGTDSYTLSNVFTPTVYSSDVEPNDTQAESVSIGLNGAINGHLQFWGNGSMDYYDYYSFTTIVDGKISFAVVPGTTLDAYLDLYDQNGYSYMRGSYETGQGITDSLIFENLKAGTYFIRVGGGGYGSYTLNNLFTPTDIPNGNDAEPNDTQEQSVTISMNSSATGHLYYFGNGTYDYYDYYSFTTPSDGKIAFALIPQNTLDAYLDLYDQNGYSYLQGSVEVGLGVSDSLIYENLKAGTYYIRVGGGGFGSYTLKNTFTATAIPNGNDTEPDDTPAQANPLTINGSTTGHINYYGNGSLDYYDWFTFSTSAKGTLTIRAVPEPSLDSYLDLFSADGNRFFATSYEAGMGKTDTLIYQELEADSYGVRISGGGYGSYTIFLSFQNTVGVNEWICDKPVIIADVQKGILTVNNIMEPRNCSVEVYDMMGRQMLKEKLNNPDNPIEFNGKRGIFLVKVSSPQGVYLSKVAF